MLSVLATASDPVRRRNVTQALTAELWLLAKSLDLRPAPTGYSAHAFGAAHRNGSPADRRLQRQRRRCSRGCSERNSVGRLANSRRRDHLRRNGGR